MIQLFIPSPSFVDLVANHPEVRPTLEHGHYRLGSAALLADPANVCLAYEEGFALFVGLGAGVYEGHIAVLPAGRGKRALDFGREALRTLFTATDALRLSSPVPMALPAARQYCRALGLKVIRRDLFLEYFETEKLQWAA